MAELPQSDAEKAPTRASFWQLFSALWAFAVRVVRRADQGHLGLVAAGVAFYAMLGIFPAITALVSLYGLIANPSDVQSQLDALAGFFPMEATSLLSRALSAALQGLLNKSDTSLNLGFAIGLGLSLLSARVAVGALMTGLDIAQGEGARRSFIRGQAVGFALTCSLIGLAILALAAVTVIPVALSVLPLPEGWRTGLGLMRWVVLALAINFSIGLLYRRAPSHEPGDWRDLVPGTMFATLMWLAGSGLFSAYVTRFGRYDAMYGSLGAVIVLLLWLWITALIVLLGAVINAELTRMRRQG